MILTYVRQNQKCGLPDPDSDWDGGTEPVFLPVPVPAGRFLCRTADLALRDAAQRRPQLPERMLRMQKHLSCRIKAGNGRF